MKATARAIIENVKPQIDCGKYAVKRIPGERLDVSADIFGDGHDLVNARLLHRKIGEKSWNEEHFRELDNDEWIGHFIVGKPGTYEYAIVAWLDHALTWHHGLEKKAAASKNVSLELLVGAAHLRKMSKKCSAGEKKYLLATAKLFEATDKYQDAVAIARSERLLELLETVPLRENETYSAILQLVVERPKAAFSNWYEFFPRSASSDINRSGTFKDCIEVLNYVAELGFDTLYFPPIHPVGVAHRKGKNNSTTAQLGEPGSPWAIGSDLGGHKSINPELGTMADFKALVKAASNLNIEIALDLAYQCSPDHPYVKEHPQWFKWRPDGTVQYAENPPKKYQDVLPINFECDDWQNLWNELKSIIEFWIDKGIRIFRVDNPHTKPFVFWEWIMSEMRRDHPNVIFLSEAFTRPKIMARLAKVGFQQSYSYFTWRNTAKELEDYLTELTKTELREYFRANFWPNTPDILPFNLQNTDHAHSAVRYALASTLSSNYGMYGPVYELLENTPNPGKEEYFNSEKYEVRHWNWSTDSPMHQLIKKVNRIRQENSAFHTTFNIEFCETDNEQLLAFLKISTDKKNSILTVVNLDPTAIQKGWIHVPVELFNAHEGHSLDLNDLMDNIHYHWNRQWNYVELDPAIMPMHIFRLTINT